MRAIDADKLLRLRYTHIIQFWEGKLIKSLPLSEVPTLTYEDLVPHGRWVSLTDCSNAGVYCSICHKKVWKEDYAWCNKKNKLRSNFCPNCGAKMDEE